MNADVVIIGGGIVGSSIAYHLSEQGCTNVVVLEREAVLGIGSTGKSMGGVRAQFATPVNIQMSLYSIPFYASFDEVVGYPAGYRPQGYLFMATRPSHLEYLRANYELQVALGLRNVSLISRDDITGILPELRSDDILGGSFCSTDGFVDPYSVMTGFITRAMERGVTVIRDAEVTGIDVEDGRVAAVRTAREKIATRVVVNAAGAWAAAVAKMTGVDLPVEPLRRMLVPTEPFDSLPKHLPMMIDMSNGWHFRPEGLGFLMAWNDPEETPGYKTNFDPAFIEKILTRAVERVPVFENAAVNPRRAWAGLYEVSPDHHAILGPAPGVGGLYFANGFSGHGVMHSPATGKITADLILRGATTVVDDASILNASRFAEGKLLHETAVL
ncbi:MAG: FAD-binding oxidoreductase [Deltaproteobacteria bacterium]|nr:FAD-binding oxidoreductase [Deltaproteobacteria bacterium]